MKKTKKIKLDSRRTVAFRTQMQIGQLIAAQLPQYKTQAQVAREMNLSRTMVARIEAQALYKLFIRARLMRSAGLV